MCCFDVFVGILLVNYATAHCAFCQQCIGYSKENLKLHTGVPLPPLLSLSVPSLRSSLRSRAP